MHTQINVKTASNEKCSVLSDSYFCLSDSIRLHTSNGTLQKMLMLGAKSQGEVKDLTTTKQSSVHRVLCGTNCVGPTKSECLRGYEVSVFSNY